MCTVQIISALHYQFKYLVFSDKMAKGKKSKKDVESESEEEVVVAEEQAKKSKKDKKKKETKTLETAMDNLDLEDSEPETKPVKKDKKKKKKEIQFKLTSFFKKNRIKYFENFWFFKNFFGFCQKLRISGTRNSGTCRYLRHFETFLRYSEMFYDIFEHFKTL